MIIEVVNQKLGERLTFDTPEALVRHLMDRLVTRGHYLLQYDDIIVRESDGWTHIFRGPYVLLHALAGLPLAGIPKQASIAAGRQA